MSKWPREVAQSYASLGEQSHVPILYEALLPLLGELRGKTLLDFGCGDGRLACKLARQEPARIVCMDQSDDLLATARQEAAALPDRLAQRFDFRHAEEEALPTPERFDVVLCSLMLMMCESRPRLERAVGGLIASLTTGGDLLLVLTHPCFRQAVHATYHNKLPADFSYWHSGQPYDVILAPQEQQVHTTISDYHWRLEDYFTAIEAGGGVVRALRETPGQVDTQGQPVGEPAYLILVVQPQAGTFLNRGKAEA